MIGLGAIATFFGSNKSGIMFGLGAAAAIGWGMWWMSERAYDDLLADSAAKIERAQQNARTAEAALVVSNATIDQMRAEAFEDYKEQLKQEAERDRLRKERDAFERQLTSYRKRWENVATKKPELLSRVINRATVKRVQRIEAATCRTDCDTDQDSDAGSEPR